MIPTTEAEVPEFTADQYARCFRIAPKLAGLLKQLVEGNRLTAHDIEARGLAHRAPNAIQKLRPRIEKHGIIIASQKGLGYWVDPESQAVALKVLHDYAHSGHAILKTMEGHE